MFNSDSVGRCWGTLPAENERADREIELVDDPGAEQAVVDAATSLAEQTFHVPFFAQPPERLWEIDFLAAENFHISNFLKPIQTALWRAFSGEDDDWRKPMFEDFRFR